MRASKSAQRPSAGGRGLLSAARAGAWRGATVAADADADRAAGAPGAGVDKEFGCGAGGAAAGAASTTGVGGAAMGATVGEASGAGFVDTAATGAGAVGACRCVTGATGTAATGVAGRDRRAQAPAPTNTATATASPSGNAHGRVGGTVFGRLGKGVSGCLAAGAAGTVAGGGRDTGATVGATMPVGSRSRSKSTPAADGDASTADKGTVPSTGAVGLASTGSGSGLGVGVNAAANAAEKAAAVSYRCSGFLAKARATTASTAAGNSALRVDGGGGSSCTMARCTPKGPLPAKGRCPVSSW